MDIRSRAYYATYYLYQQMLKDGISAHDKQSQIQYVLDMLNIINDGKLNMVEDIIDNIKKFKYNEEHMISLYTKLLSEVVSPDELLDIDNIVGEFNFQKDIDLITY